MSIDTALGSIRMNHWAAFWPHSFNVKRGHDRFRSKGGQTFRFSIDVGGPLDNCAAAIHVGPAYTVQSVMICNSKYTAYTSEPTKQGRGSSVPIFHGWTPLGITSFVLSGD